MITYRTLSLDEVSERMLEIDVTEHGEVVYYWVENAVSAVAESWDRPQWTQKASTQDSWAATLSLPGVKVWGAFDAERLVGLVVYRPHLTENMAQLSALFVSRSHRRQGIAARLTAEVCRQARQDGHARLYVSATPSESAVGFYRGQGFIPTQETHPELYALEPEDIHMIMAL